MATRPIPCDFCRAPVPIPDDWPVDFAVCGPCQTQAEVVIAEALCRYADVDGHRCTNRDGDPIRAGQACWPSARADIRSGVTR